VLLQRDDGVELRLQAAGLRSVAEAQGASDRESNPEAEESSDGDDRVERVANARGRTRTGLVTLFAAAATATGIGPAAGLGSGPPALPAGLQAALTATPGLRRLALLLGRLRLLRLGLALGLLLLLLAFFFFLAFFGSSALAFFFFLAFFGSSALAFFFFLAFFGSSALAFRRFGFAVTSTRSVFRWLGRGFEILRRLRRRPEVNPTVRLPPARGASWCMDSETAAGRWLLRSVRRSPRISRSWLGSLRVVERAMARRRAS
jgi:hypothetical protein